MGRRQDLLVADDSRLTPALSLARYRYYEPMVGGGAVYFRLARQFRTSIIGDINPDLVNLYRTVQSQVEDLITELHSGRYFFVHKSQKRTLANYRRIRAAAPTDSVERAARLMFLLKTCFNGLMRTNRAGFFNTPPGSYRNPVICDAEELRLAAHVLTDTVITDPLDAATAIESIPKRLRPVTFLFVDPPYHSDQSQKFTKYSGVFTSDQQIALARAVIQSGCPYIYTNRATALVKQLFATAKQLVVPLKHSIQPRYTTGLIEHELIATNL